jgi:hypothetical protein
VLLSSANLSRNRENWAERARTDGSPCTTRRATFNPTLAPSMPALSSLAPLSHCISVMTVLICEAVDSLGHRWLFKRGEHATEKSVKKSGNSGGIQTKNGDATGNENGGPTRALKPHPNRKISKHPHKQHNQDKPGRRRQADQESGEISIISMNSMPTHAEIGGVAPGPPLQFERGHSGHPNVPAETTRTMTWCLRPARAPRSCWQT